MYAACCVWLCVLELPLAAPAVCPLDTCVEEQSQMCLLTAGVRKHGDYVWKREKHKLQHGLSQIVWNQLSYILVVQMCYKSTLRNLM